MSIRGVGLALGVGFALLTALELVVGEATLGDADLLRRTTKLNIFHWTVALAMLGAFFTGSPGAARTTMRVAGFVLVAVTLWGGFWPDGLGSSLGFVGGIPAAYNVYHGVAAALALAAGFVARPRAA